MEDDVDSASAKDGIIEIAEQWRKRAWLIEKTHFRRSVRLHNWHIGWGAAALATSTLLGLSASANSSDVNRIFADITAVFGWSRDLAQAALDSIQALLAVSVPVLTALASFLRFEARSSAHHKAAIEFSSLKRRLQELVALTHPLNNFEKSKRELEIIRMTWDKLVQQVPLPGRVDPRLDADYDSWTYFGDKRSAIGDVMLSVIPQTITRGRLEN